MVQQSEMTGIKMSHPAAPLFLHADDFGMSRCITDGIIDTFANGVLTSTSMLMNAPEIEYAVSRWRWLETERGSGHLETSLRQQCGDPAVIPFDLGVHLNLTQGRPVTAEYPPELLNQEGFFPGVGAVFRKLLFGQERWRQAVRCELMAQISRLVDYSIQPTHLNGHQYVSLIPFVSSMIPELMQHFRIRVVRVAFEKHPLNAWFGNNHRVLHTVVAFVKRHYALKFRRVIQDARLSCPAQFFGTSHAGRIRLPLLQRFLNSAVVTESCEIGIHPGRPPESDHTEPVCDGWADPLSDLRPLELQLLVNPGTAQLIQRSGRPLSRLRLLGDPTGNPV